MTGWKRLYITVPTEKNFKNDTECKNTSNILIWWEQCTQDVGVGSTEFVEKQGKHDNELPPTREKKLTFTQTCQQISHPKTT